MTRSVLELALQKKKLLNRKKTLFVMFAKTNTPPTADCKPPISRHWTVWKTYDLWVGAIYDYPGGTGMSEKKKELLAD